MSIGKVIAANGLSDIEETIFDLLKNLLSKNLVFQFDPEFIEYCSQRVKASELEVYQALYSLLQRKYIVPGSTLTRDTILENHNRNLIYNTIYNHPGMHIRELCAFLNLSSGVVRSHIQVLEMFAIIRKKTYLSPKLTLLFFNDYPDTYDDFFLIIKNENDHRIVQLLIQTPLAISELSSTLGLHHSTIQYHLEKLERLDLVIRLESPQGIHYTFNKAKIESFTDFQNRIVSYLQSND